MQRTLLLSCLGLAGLLGTMSTTSYLALGQTAKASPRTDRLKKGSELRAIWVHPIKDFGKDAEKGKKEINDFTARLADAHFNAIFAWVTSEYAIALANEKYKKRLPQAEWDSVGELIQAAGRHHVHVHLWYSLTGYKNRESPEFDPEVGGNPQWIAKRVDEVYPGRRDQKLPAPRVSDACPVYPEVRDFELKVIERLVEHYPTAAGVHVEEPGYTTPGYCYCPHCREVFKKTYRFEQIEAHEGAQAEALKCSGTDEYMRRLHQLLERRSTPLMLSANGSFSWSADRKKGRNWLRWAKQNHLAFYAAQVYTTDLTAFQKRTDQALHDLRPFCPVCVGIGSGKIDDLAPIPVSVTLREIDIARAKGAQGVAIFCAGTMPPDLLAALKKGPFKKPAY
jgi:uncharacterized lipoprotein YddW (UPF0748 family)